MREFFNMDNGFFRALGRLADIMILNVTFLIFCIPIVTIGASLTGMYYVALKMAENEEGYIIRGFWKSFKQNFKQATVIWIAMLIVALVLIMDFQILGLSTGSLAKPLYIGIIAVSFIYLMVFSYVFPLLARFYNTIRGTFKNAILIAIANLPYTVLIIIVTVVPVAVTFYNTYTLWYGILIWLMAGFAGIAYVNSYFYKKIFVKFMPEEKDDTDHDHWEMDEEEVNEEVKTSEEE